MTLPPEEVVTCFVVRQERILLLKRSQKVGTYRGCWSGISGYLENDDPEARAWTELREETGATPGDLTLERRGVPVIVLDKETEKEWRVFPFRFSARIDFEPRLDWENVELNWVTPEALETMNTVPGLKEVWVKVAF